MLGKSINRNDSKELHFYKKYAQFLALIAIYQVTMVNTGTRIIRLFKVKSLKLSAAAECFALLFFHRSCPFQHNRVLPWCFVNCCYCPMTLSIFLFERLCSDTKANLTASTYIWAMALQVTIFGVYTFLAKEKISVLFVIWQKVTLWLTSKFGQTQTTFSRLPTDIPQDLFSLLFKLNYCHWSARKTYWLTSLVTAPTTQRGSIILSILRHRGDFTFNIRKLLIGLR